MFSIGLNKKELSIMCIMRSENFITGQETYKVIFECEKKGQIVIRDLDAYEVQGLCLIFKMKEYCRNSITYSEIEIKTRGRNTK